MKNSAKIVGKSGSWKKHVKIEQKIYKHWYIATLDDFDEDSYWIFYRCYLLYNSKKRTFKKLTIEQHYTLLNTNFKTNPFLGFTFKTNVEVGVLNMHNKEISDRFPVKCPSKIIKYNSQAATIVSSNSS